MTEAIDVLDFAADPVQAIIAPDAECHACGQPTGGSVGFTARAPEDWRPGDWIPPERMERIDDLIAGGWRILPICDRCRHDDEPRSRDFRDRAEAVARSLGRRPPA